MDEGRKFRIYPTKEQITPLSKWIGHQRFIYNSKVSEDRYFRKFKSKYLSLVGEDVPCDQKYSQFISTDTSFLKESPPRYSAMVYIAGSRHTSDSLRDSPADRLSKRSMAGSQ